MKRIAAALLVLASAVPAAAQDDVAHTQFVRPVFADAPGQPHFLVVDEDTWRHARRDLADLRLRDAAGQAVPYALRTHGDVTDPREMAARLLQPGRAGTRTRFWIQIPAEIQEYNRVRLDLTARDFVNAARVEGADAVDAREWTDLGEHTLFDFSSERLGANLVLQLPATRFRYLRVTVSTVRPEEVRAAFVEARAFRAARWLTLGLSPKRGDEPGRTVFRWNVPAPIPLERVRFDIDPAAQNFVRRVDVLVDGRATGGGTVRRVNRRYGTTTARVEELEMALPPVHGRVLEIAVVNGDDAPLPIEGIAVLAQERRLYFDPAGRRELLLYFGDAGATAPRYDFARWFHEQDAALEARPGPVTTNSAYRPRPDLRPWTERNPWLLWSALGAAVLVLGALAVRALRTA